MSDIFPLPKFGLSSLIKAFANFTLKGSDEVSAKELFMEIPEGELVKGYPAQYMKQNVVDASGKLTQKHLTV